MNVRIAGTAAWLIAAAFFAVVLASIVHVDMVGRLPPIALLLIAIVCAAKPELGLPLVAAAIPIAWYVAGHLSNSRVSWAEAVACAAIAGLSLSAARSRAAAVPARLAVPAAMFGALVVTAVVAALGVMRQRLGPPFSDALLTHLTRAHFVDVGGFPALHAGMLLLEGVLLFTLAARLAVNSEHALQNVARATAAGAGLAAAANGWQLLRTAMRHDRFWQTLRELAAVVRWNVHYPDFNAAGSYFVMVAFVAAALWFRERRARALWAGCFVLSVTALWLTGSRAAQLAGLLGGAGVLLYVPLSRSTPQKRTVALAGLGASIAVALLVGAAAILPQRINQHSALTAADVRIGLARTSFRMIAVHPIFGIGLGEFYQRSGDPAFTDSDLLAKFPAAVHENAHNNFLQVAAELGIPGGALFAWLILAALVLVARQSARSGALHWHLITAGLGAFVLTLLAGHPLLIPEPAYAFWILLGTSAGAAAALERPARSSRAVRAAAAVVLLAIAICIPWRLDALAADTDFEHVCVGCSPWQFSREGIRSRDIEGHATLFVPADMAFQFSMNPGSAGPVAVELRLDGRLANSIMLPAGRWTDVTIPARTEHSDHRYARLEIRALTDADARIAVTKVKPIGVPR